jgi:hypothetical protein
VHAILIFLVISSSSTGDDPIKPEPPTSDQLAVITRRGKLLAEYDQAAWHSSDAFQKLNPNAEGVARYIARKTEKGWVVAFGRLDEKKNRFLVAYEANQGKKSDEFQVKSFDPPAEDAKFNRSAARAIDTAQKDFVEKFKGEQRPYNVAVLPAEKSEHWVYFVPAPTKVDVWPLGGDVRYLMSDDGSRIIEKRQLHTAIIENPAPKPDPELQVAAGIHNHVLDDTPGETDVFHVLARKPAIPELIVTEKFFFEIAVDGKIKYGGTAEAFRKSAQKKE